MKKIRRLVLKTIDANIKHEVLNIYVFTHKYKKKIMSNEFHSPGPSKIIIETENEIIRWIFKDVIIQTDENGNIKINSADLYNQIILDMPYFTDIEYKKAYFMAKAYKKKSLIDLTPTEIAENDWAVKIIGLYAVTHLIKIPRYIGGGL